MATLSKEYKRQYYEKNKVRIKEQLTAYAKKYPERARARCRKFARTLKGRFSTYKGGAKARGLIFDISLPEFLEIINLPCYYCGEQGYGIDRINSSIGYLKNNIVSCCSMCNWMKQQYLKEEFIEQCKKIAKNWAKDL